MCRRRRTLPARHRLIGGGGLVLDISPLWLLDQRSRRHSGCVFPAAAGGSVWSLPITYCRAGFIRKSENFKMCSVRIPPKTPPCACSLSASPLRCIRAGYWPRVWCWLSRRGMPWLPFVRLCLVPGFFITQRKNEEAKAKQREAKEPRKSERSRCYDALSRKRNSKTPSVPNFP